MTRPNPLSPKQLALIKSHMLPSASGCILWTGQINAKGYGLITLGLNGRRVRSLAHRMVYALELGDPFGMSVCHTCDNPTCVNPDHLWLGTQADNNLDMRAKDRATRGETHGSAKLTDAQVAEIRSRYLAGGTSQRKLAAEFGVTYAHIAKIVRNRGRVDAFGEAKERLSIKFREAQKLTAEKAREIRERYAQGGVSYLGLAREYGVSKPQIGRVIRRESWA